MNLALVVAFDFIEFPLLSLAGTKRELENAKSLYTKNVRVLTAYFSMAVLVLAMSSCFLSYLWNHSLATLMQKAVHLFDSVLVATFGQAENVIHLDSAASRFVSSLVNGLVSLLVLYSLLLARCTMPSFVVSIGRRRNCLLDLARAFKNAFVL